MYAALLFFSRTIRDDTGGPLARLRWFQLSNVLLEARSQLKDSLASVPLAILTLRRQVSLAASALIARSSRMITNCVFYSCAERRAKRGYRERGDYARGFLLLKP